MKVCSVNHISLRLVTFNMPQWVSTDASFMPSRARNTNATKRHKEDASSGDELQDSKIGRMKLERWASHKEIDDAVTVKALSTSSKLHRH
ncbi:hypothetical protein Bca4012_076323 [Brassica carinata]